MCVPAVPKGDHDPQGSTLGRSTRAPQREMVVVRVQGGMASTFNEHLLIPILSAHFQSPPSIDFKCLRVILSLSGWLQVTASTLPLSSTSGNRPWSCSDLGGSWSSWARRARAQEKLLCNEAEFLAQELPRPHQDPTRKLLHKMAQEIARSFSCTRAPQDQFKNLQESNQIVYIECTTYRECTGLVTPI